MNSRGGHRTHTEGAQNSHQGGIALTLRGHRTHSGGHSTHTKGGMEPTQRGHSTHTLPNKKRSKRLSAKGLGRQEKSVNHL